MLRKQVVAIVIILAIVIGQSVGVMAQEKPAIKPQPVKIAPPAKSDITKPIPQKTEPGKDPSGMPPKPHQKMAANMMAVCSCGMTFKPDANTKYFEYEGKEFACCSDYCYEKGTKDPATSAKTIEDRMNKMIKPMDMKMR